MLLRALNQYRGDDDVVPVGYARKAVGFVLQIEPDARGCSLHSQYEVDATDDGKQRRVAPTRLVPNIVRTSGPVPMLGCDNAGYVLGRPKPVDDPAKLAKEAAVAQLKAQLFDQLIQEYASHTGDDDAWTFLRWRENGSPGVLDSVGRLDDFSVKRLDLDLIQIQVGASGPIHFKPAAQQFWSARATSSKSGSTTSICLSCGQLRPVVDTLPQSLTGALIPATSTSNVALLSVNFAAASRGASGTGLRSAPICAECASGAVSAFNTLAASETNRWGGRSDDRATIWWTTGTTDDINVLENPDPERVRRFYEAAESGRRPLGVLKKRDAERFYALTFSGNVARLVIRDWIDLPLDNVSANVVAWFEASATPDPAHEYFGISEMARSCGDFVPSDGLYSAMPEGSREALLRSALAGADLPHNMLTRAVNRARAEIHYTSLADARQAGVVRRRASARFAVIRLMLNRWKPKEIALPKYLDEDLDDPAYLSGRLFAERESLQHQALGDVNSSIADRFFERASASPMSVEHSLAALEKQHLKALARSGKREAAVAIDKRLGALHERIRVQEIPKRMPVEQQALWISGYYQQRQENFRMAAQRKQSPTNTEDD
ncbi:MAG: hypothetical protein EPO13_09040 [Actinomycetota bacterium]|nr:MAG: hypothetical protein EPO13_09040 [Actinomycetota bacterium]